MGGSPSIKSNPSGSGPPSVGPYLPEPVTAAPWAAGGGKGGQPLPQPGVQPGGIPGTLNPIRGAGGYTPPVFDPMSVLTRGSPASGFIKTSYSPNQFGDAVGYGDYITTDPGTGTPPTPAPEVGSGGGGGGASTVRSSATNPGRPPAGYTRGTTTLPDGRTVNAFVNTTFKSGPDDTRTETEALRDRIESGVDKDRFRHNKSRDSLADRVEKLTATRKQRDLIKSGAGTNTKRGVTGGGLKSEIGGAYDPRAGGGSKSKKSSTSKKGSTKGNAGWGFTSIKDAFDGGGPGKSGDSYTGGIHGSKTVKKKDKKSSSKKGKVVCTAMNEDYGFGSFRQAIWLKYSEDHLTKAHEVGYHAMFLPLLAARHKWYGKPIYSLLKHIARHRTADLRAEMQGTKRNRIGQAWRFILEPLVYTIGRIKGAK